MNGILATVMLTQMFMSELAQAYPQGTNLSAVSKVDGPGCCYFASRPMRMPDSLDTVTQRTDLRQQQRLLTELDVLIHACRNSVGERIEHAAIGTHYALLEAFLQKVRYDLLGLRAPALPEGADVRTFYYEMVYRCTGEQREVRKPAPEEPAPPPVQPSCGFELTFLLEDGCEGAASPRRRREERDRAQLDHAERAQDPAGAVYCDGLPAVPACTEAGRATVQPRRLRAQRAGARAPRLVTRSPH
ncbi:MAG TPA: hypothetical protein VD838_05905 [Anaeromyxobacteraceae bacterium]|nr:hypothetical protein [Anaeromyxobacteraceae bacterium]